VAGDHQHDEEHHCGEEEQGDEMNVVRARGMAVVVCMSHGT
jgi:hypothetical protein